MGLKKEVRIYPYTPDDELESERIADGLPRWFRVSGGNPHLMYEVRASSHQEAIEKVLSEAERQGLDFGYSIVSVQHEAGWQRFIENRHGERGDVVRVIPGSTDPYSTNEGG